MKKDNQMIQVFGTSESIFPKSIVEAKMSVTPNQMDVLAILLAEIGKDTDVDSNLVYTLSAKDYADLKEYENPKKAYEVLKEKVCGETSKHRLGMRHIGFDMWMGDDKYLQYNWFSQVVYDSGNVIFTLTPQIKEFLVEFKKTDEFKVYAKLQYILPMRSQFSKKLYLMCREFVYSGKRFCDTDWNEFLEKLGVKESYSYVKIKTLVLEKAKAEINEFSDIKIDYQIKEKAVKGGKQPISISFEIHKKTKSIESLEDWD